MEIDVVSWMALGVSGFSLSISYLSYRASLAGQSFTVQEKRQSIINLLQSEEFLAQNLTKRLKGINQKVALLQTKTGGNDSTEWFLERIGDF